MPSPEGPGTTPGPTAGSTAKGAGASSAVEVTLEQAAALLGVHYMTAYRYVRTGRLPAQRRGGQWRVMVSDIGDWANRAGTTTGARGPAAQAGESPATRDWPEELSRALLDSSESAAWEIVQDALTSTYAPEDLYLDVLAAAMRSIGNGWEAGEVSVADEHRASAVMSRLIGRLGPLFIKRGRPRGAVLLGAPSGDHHSLPTALLADPLRGRGYLVVDLGADTPTESFVEQAVRHEVVAIGVALSKPRPLAEISELANALVGATLARIVLGGVALAAIPGPDQEQLQSPRIRLTSSYGQALAELDVVPRRRSVPVP